MMMNWQITASGLKWSVTAAFVSRQKSSVQPDIVSVLVLRLMKSTPSQVSIVDKKGRPY